MMKKVRTLKKRIVKPKKRRKPIMLNIGCGVTLFPGFINVDNYLDEEGLKSQTGLYANVVYPKGAKFVKADILSLPFKDNYADYIECLEMLEHLPFRDVEKAIVEMHRVLKPGGRMVLMVPDMDDMVQVWKERITDKPLFNHNTFFGLVQQFYGNQLHDGEYHTSAFTETYLRGLLHACGFDEDKICVTPYHHGEHPPEFPGARWDPRQIFIIGMLHAETIKSSKAIK